MKTTYNLEFNHNPYWFSINLPNSPQFTFSSSPLIRVLLSVFISHECWLQSSTFISVQFENNHFFEVSFARVVYNRKLVNQDLWMCTKVSYLSYWRCQRNRNYYRSSPAERVTPIPIDDRKGRIGPILPCINCSFVSPYVSYILMQGICVAFVCFILAWPNSIFSNFWHILASCITRLYPCTYNSTYISS